VKIIQGKGLSMSPVEMHHPRHGRLSVEPGNKATVQIGDNPFQIGILRCDSQDQGGSFVIGTLTSPDTMDLHLETILLKGDTHTTPTRSGDLMVRHVIKRPEA